MSVLARTIRFLKNHIIGVFIVGIATGLIATAMWEFTGEILDRCESVVPIKELGWSSGHKTNFCISKGFDGNFNFGEYSAGGYCYKGDYEACKVRVEPGVK